VDTIGADQDIATDHCPVRTRAIKKMGCYTGFVLLECAYSVAGVHLRCADSLEHGPIYHRLQSASVNRELRKLIPGSKTARLTPDLLAKAVGIEQLVGADGDRIESFQQAKLCKLADGMREGIDPNPEFANGFCLLEDIAVDASGMEHERGRQAADAAACDDNLQSILSLFSSAAITTRSRSRCTVS
jgi:hypothetical protein